MAFVVLLFNSGARFTLSLLLHPMSLDLGWSRTTLSSVVTVFMVVSALSLPLVGHWVDRWGPRLVLVGGVTVSGLALATMGFIQLPVHAFVLYGLVFALGSAATSITPIGVLLSRWYPHRTGMANSVAISGMGVGQLLIISVLAAQVLVLGWRGSYIALGIAVLAVALPLVYFGSRPATPESPPVAAGAGSPGAAPSPLAQSVAPVLGKRSFWALAMMYAVCGFQDFLVATHIVAFALDEGLSSLVAGNMLAFMGLAGLVGVLTTGVLNDRFGAALPTGLCFVIRLVLFAAVLASREPWLIIAMALGYGFTFWMTAPLTVVFVRALAGMALLGTLTGLITMVHHISGGAGALVGAWIFDASGNYDAALWVMLISSAVALGLTPFFPRTRAR